jgi:hypothetical protein
MRANVKIYTVVLCARSALLLLADDIQTGRESIGSTVTVPLSAYGDFRRSVCSARIEFSPQGDQVCVWYPNPKLEYGADVPYCWLILKTTGGFVTWCESPARDNGTSLTNFPSLAAAVKWRSLFTGATAHAIDIATSRAVRAFPRRRDVDPLLTPTCRIEMVKLGVEHSPLVWSKEAESFHSVARLAFLPSPGGTNILVAFGGTDALLLDVNTGAVLSIFTYGPMTSDAEAIRRKRKFRLPYSEGDPALYFGARVVGVSAEKRLLAAGGFFDRRVRVVSLDAPFPMIRQFHEEENPCSPPGGIWIVDSLEFAAAGKFLVVESDFGGRGTLLQMHETEIIETQRWRTVWKANKLDLHSVTLSPDGEKIAFIEDNVLKIAPFAVKNK